MIALLLAITLGVSAPAPEVEAQAQAKVLAPFEQSTRPSPVVDRNLSLAARELARRALASSAQDAADLEILTAAVSEAGLADPSPRTLVLRGSPASEPLNALGRRDDLTRETTSHVGIGAYSDGATVALVVLLVDRRAEVELHPRQLPKKAPPQPVCAQLAGDLPSAEVFVTRPNGTVDRQPMKVTAHRACAELEFPGEGRHTVEVLARGPKGPEVVAIYFVGVGAPNKGSVSRVAEPKTPAEAAVQVLRAINALRDAHQLEPLTRDAELDAVAQHYAERMGTEGFFAHVAPDGEDLKGRLGKAGYRFQTAGENLGQASGPLAAHFGIEHSPGHRKNLLEPGYSRAGLGQHRQANGQLILVEVFAAPVPGSGAADPVAEAYAAIDAVRIGRKLPALKHVPLFEALANEHVRLALQLNSPKVKLEGSKLHDRVFAARADVAAAAADFYVADSSALVVDSRNLVNPQNSLVGVGLVKGDSPTYGNDKFWIVVIYAARRE